MLPFSFGELCEDQGLFAEKQECEKRMLFGSYPDVVANPGDEQQRLSELAGLTGTDGKTVARYIELLTKCYIVFPLGAYSGNLRNEIKKGFKIFFYDLGIRNAVINNFTPLASRNDAGEMWENYLILERPQKNLNQPFPLRSCFLADHGPAKP